MSPATLCIAGKHFHGVLQAQRLSQFSFVMVAYELVFVCNSDLEELAWILFVKI